MAKILHVIAPFFVAEIGDKFELNDNGMYVLNKDEEFHKVAGDSSSEVKSSYSSKITISKEYAQELLEDGYLEEGVDKKMDKPFVNVFDEIEGLLGKYTTELNNIDKTMKDAPEVIKLEKTTVLSNLIKVLNYLKNLKK